MSRSSSSRDDQGRQKPSDRGTDVFWKQVKPAGGERSVEASPARDDGKSDVGVWEAIFERENMETALKRDNQRAMRLSLAVGVLMLVGKVGAYVVTGSAAILSDAAESVIHVAAVAFAAFSLSLSFRPADREFRYGYERIAFFSAGFEGAMIVVAAIVIIGAAVDKWMHGLELNRLGFGTGVVAAAAALNAALGFYLVRMGRRSHSLILEANGRHVLTDSWTSVGVVGGLLLVLWTGWLPFDPILAILVALNILWSGAQVIRRSSASSVPPALCALRSGRFVDHGRRAMVVFSFQFNGEAQDTGCPSVIMPSLRLNFWESLRENDLGTWRIIA